MLQAELELRAAVVGIVPMILLAEQSIDGEEQLALHGEHRRHLIHSAMHRRVNTEVQQLVMDTCQDKQLAVSKLSGSSQAGVAEDIKVGCSQVGEWAATAYTDLAALRATFAAERRGAARVLSDAARAVYLNWAKSNIATAEVVTRMSSNHTAGMAEREAMLYRQLQSAQETFRAAVVRLVQLETSNAAVRSTQLLDLIAGPQHRLQVQAFKNILSFDSVLEVETQRAVVRAVQEGEAKALRDHDGSFLRGRSSYALKNSVSYNLEKAAVQATLEGGQELSRVAANYEDLRAYCRTALPNITAYAQEVYTAGTHGDLSSLLDFCVTAAHGKMTTPEEIMGEYTETMAKVGGRWGEVHGLKTKGTEMLRRLYVSLQGLGCFDLYPDQEQHLGMKLRLNNYVLGIASSADIESSALSVLSLSFPVELYIREDMRIKDIFEAQAQA